ncbi:calmodulin-like [Cucurbita maxima]|uniref:Calmodulin-like n=1 Tax=Cucurbita maxima TaxID=3661 RepID=A0A6J1KUW2_CUCMA|nr:calmodulin-like [Cucurbita maxima]
MSEASLQLHRDQAHGAEAEAQEFIQNYDKNADSSLSKEELSAAIHHNQAKNPGSHKPEAKKKDVAPKAQKVPAKAAEEKGASMKLSRSQIKEIFMEHDIDGDGYLSVSELTKAFSFFGSIIPLYKAHYGLAYADADGDGLISEEELEKLVDYAERTNKKKRGF